MIVNEDNMCLNCKHYKYDYKLCTMQDKVYEPYEVCMSHEITEDMQNIKLGDKVIGSLTHELFQYNSKK